MDERLRGLPRLLGAGAIVTALFAPARALAEDEARAVAGPRSSSEDDIRRRLLLENQPWRGQVAALNVVPAVFGTLFLGLGVVSLIDDNEWQPATRTIMAGSNAFLSAAAFGTYFAPRPLRAPLLVSESSLWFAGFALAWSYEPTDSTETRQVWRLAAGVSAVEAAIPLLDALVAPPPDPWALESDREALETSDSTARHAQVVRAERNLGRTTRPLRFVGPLVYLAGITSMTIVAARSGSDETEHTALGLGLVFSTLASTQLLTAALPSAGQRYERALRRFRLAPLGPRGSAGATASWRF